MSIISHRTRRVVSHPLKTAKRAAEEVRDLAMAEPSRQPSVEVWQWTKPKYRIRAVVLLLCNALLFVGLGCFTFWLRTGEYPFAIDNYWHTWWEAFDPLREKQVTLIDFLVYPIPVNQVPLMMVIMGLVLASLTAIPILVSILYRFPFALVFTAIICFVAVVPWLAITVTFCCLLARWKPLQFSFRFATAMIALLPLVVYYWLATRNASAAAMLPPLELARLYLPWVIALSAACVLMALVLTIARLVNYRPGAIAPLMAVMFATPVLLFETKVGRDELYYRLLETRYGPGSTTHFVDFLDAMPTIRRIADERLRSINDPTVSPEAILEQVRTQIELQVASIAPEREREGIQNLEVFAMEQFEAVHASDDFVARFPESRYIPNALYLKGRALDMRIDEPYFRRTAIVLHYQDFPNNASRTAWQWLHDEYQDYPALWAVATYRLAMIDARGGDIDGALRLLDELIAGSGSAARNPASAPAGGWRLLFAKSPPAETLDINSEAVILEARKLRNLLFHNRDPQQNDLPLRRLLSFNPRHAHYQSNLRQMEASLAARHPLTPLRDNLQVLMAAANPSRSRRIEMLEAFIREADRQPDSDALPEARFQLGMAYKEDSRTEDARKQLDEVTRLHADSPWAVEARQQLANMGAAGRS